MPAMVVDASIIAALCFQDPRAAEAVNLLRDNGLHAPFLLAHELTNIARSKILRGTGTPETMRAGLETALLLPVETCSVDHLAVFQLALSTRLSAYDASYLWLARELNTSLATFDHALAAAAEAAGRLAR